MSDQQRSENLHSVFHVQHLNIDWMLDVLKDLKRFSDIHDLHSLTGHLNMSIEVTEELIAELEKKALSASTSNVIPLPLGERL